MGAALVIHPDGEIIEVNLKPGGNHLVLMYEHLGCSAVDVVRLSAVLDMWRDGDGFQEPNPVATALAAAFGYRHQPHFGPVLICASAPSGDRADLNPAQLRALRARLEDLTGG